MVLKKEEEEEEDVLVNGKHNQANFNML